MAGRELAVDVDRRVHVDAVELERQPPAGHRGRQRERLAVPARPAGEKARAAVGAAGGRGIELDAPVVREADAAPPRVVEAGRLGTGRVGQREAPAGAEVSDAARLGRTAQSSQRDDGEHDDPPGHSGTPPEVEPLRRLYTHYARPSSHSRSDTWRSE